MVDGGMVDWWVELKAERHIKVRRIVGPGRENVLRG
jgi:hypothetical protein